jgi:hypothetical protein
VRRQISSKPDTYTESMDVYVAGISVKVDAHYPGRSQRLSRVAGLLSPRGDGKDFEKSAEGIVGSSDQAEGLNIKYGEEP